MLWKKLSEDNIVQTETSTIEKDTLMISNSISDIAQFLKDDTIWIVRDFDHTLFLFSASQAKKMSDVLWGLEGNPREISMIRRFYLSSMSETRLKDGALQLCPYFINWLGASTVIDIQVFCIEDETYVRLKKGEKHG